jgi:hypothetical protein
MERREVLSGCGLLVAALGAGCTGLLGAEPSTSNPTPGTATHATPAVPPQSPGTPGGTPPAGAGGPTPEGTATPTPTPDPARQREALAAYRNGFEKRRSYGRSTEVARIGFNRGKYGGATTRYRDALERANRSVERFRTARDLADGLGRPEASRLGDRAATYTERYLVPFARRGVDASEATQQGRLEAAGEHVARMRSIVDDAASSGLDIALPDRFEDAVGL